MSEAAGFRGGSRSVAGTPTAVGGSMAPPGSNGGTPTAVGGSQIHEARNDRGTNTQIPYCRVVPLHGSDAPTVLKSQDRVLRDLRVHVVGGEPKLEYDGLHTGELAWVLGRRFMPVEDGEQGDLSSNKLDETASLSQRRVYQAGGGAGRGVDRMQRLATTGWVEARMLSKEVRASQIHLHRINLTSPYALAMHAGLAQNHTFLAGSTALDAADVSHHMAMCSDSVTRDPATKAATGHVTAGFQRQGIFVLDKGPFLRGMQAAGATVAINAAPGLFDEQHVARNLGDVLAFAGLETELRRRSIFDWTPDGIVLSAGDEGPDPINSVNLDAKSARVYNVGVQGPAVTTSWRINVDTAPTVGGWALDAQPGDKLFVCLVADVSFKLVDDTAESQRLLKLRQGVVETAAAPDADTAKAVAIDLIAASTMKGAHGSAFQPDRTLRGTYSANDEAQLRARYETAVTTLKQKVDEATNDTLPAADDTVCTLHAQRVQERLSKAQALEELQSKKESTKAALDTAQQGYDEAVADERAIFGEWAVGNEAKLKKQLETFDKIANRVRTVANKDVSCATLSNFRLVRTSSSQMANFSHFRPEKPGTSRMGLRLWAPELSGNTDGVSEYIVGGWCIGTVLDARSSRVTTMTPNIGVNHDIRPKNVAVNVQVNVQWYSGDELYKSYMDASGMVLKRGDKKRESDALGAADVDVSRASDEDAAAEAQAEADEAAAAAAAAAAAQQAAAALAAEAAVQGPNDAADGGMMAASAAGATTLAGGSSRMRVGGSSRSRTA